MGFERSCFLLFLFFFVVGLASSSPSFIKYDVLESHVQGRGLLQQYLIKDNCPINFEKEDYRPLTSQCKGPQYNAAICCNAFKIVACKHTNEINDVDNGCADSMFYYINLNGKYPIGLFANICKEDEEGLDCNNIKSLAAERQSVRSRIGNRHVTGGKN
ncbi:PREDICTED: GPI-anchored protein LLG1-like [Nicotiana attenuata]|uniref:Gpi-anchored protein lorelei n=1 Tax=Nicotiana attenuata TaxID=49451 RepID=A0A314L495_NICAT|nr:PREDICTED: GPI-anchored protein LLG1-like [Nicotiana attenuata]OIT36373.1 gpi-anchored protein lorelei [Nicotiana attenuata]